MTASMLDCRVTVSQLCLPAQLSMHEGLEDGQRGQAGDEGIKEDVPPAKGAEAPGEGLWLPFTSVSNFKACNLRVGGQATSQGCCG